MRATLKAQDTKEEKSKVVYVRVTPKMHKALTKVAEKEDRPISTVIRWAIMKCYP